MFPRPRSGAGPSRKTVAAAVEARRFTVATSRLLFEVIDRRRGIAHLGDSVSPAIADQVVALVRHDAFRVAETSGAPRGDRRLAVRSSTASTSSCATPAAPRSSGRTPVAGGSAPSPGASNASRAVCVEPIRAPLAGVREPASVRSNTAGNSWRSSSADRCAVLLTLSIPATTRPGG
ncbi:hypothetical protein MTX80_08195 [Gordonia amicalis]|nr:hypothetical protein [Gordonia amicalis]UOG22875.1 hypothetical protein MTX80_08195 [Gordonia amicalis]